MRTQCTSEFLGFQAPIRQQGHHYTLDRHQQQHQPADYGCRNLRVHPESRGDSEHLHDRDDEMANWTTVCRPIAVSAATQA